MMRISLSNRSTNNKYYYVIYNYFILTGMYITAIKTPFSEKELVASRILYPAGNLRKLMPVFECCLLYRSAL